MIPEIDDVFKEFNCFSSNQFQSIINNGTRYGKDIVLVLVWTLEILVVYFVLIHKDRTHMKISCKCPLRLSTQKKKISCKTEFQAFDHLMKSVKNDADILCCLLQHLWTYTGRHSVCQKIRKQFFRRNFLYFWNL